MKVIISGGGTGGHVYPALAVAQELKKRDTSIDILFVGAKGKMEMEKVPKAGFPIEGLSIVGLHRTRIWRNVKFPLKLISSLWKARKIIKNFKPDAAMGFGGFASGPVIYLAASKGIPSMIQEQNSYAGITNKILAKRVHKICVAYPNMKQFFQAEKIVQTGNPVRKDIGDLESKKEAAYRHFGLDPQKKTLFIFGGSLGARTLNDAVEASSTYWKTDTDIQMIWQVGKLYHDEFSKGAMVKNENVKQLAFVDRMDLAYAIADVIACRAGALTISELSIAGKAAILVPSPNVAEDHQTMNAKALADVGAAILLKDVDAKEKMINEAISLLSEDDKRQSLQNEIKKLAKPKAAEMIVDEMIKLIRNK